MLQIKAKENKCIDLGRRGEDSAREILFDITGFAELYGQGEAKLVVKRYRDLNTYTAEITQDNTTVHWVIKPVDNDHPGYGECELIYIAKNRVCKSTIYQTHTNISLSDPVATPSNPGTYAELIAKIGDLSKLSTKDKSSLVNALNEYLSPDSIFSPEMIESVLDAYLEENPISKGATEEELEQIQSNTQDIQNLSRDKLDATKLVEAIRDALAQAKRDGEFDGYTPQKNIDYFDGLSPHIGKNGNWWVGDVDTGINAKGDDYVLTESDMLYIAELVKNLIPKNKALSFTGAVNETYDGSKAVSIPIPKVRSDKEFQEQVTTILTNYFKENPLGVDFKPDETLILKDGVLSVNTTNKMEQDNTLPITSAGVFATVGNIEALLKTI